MAGDAMHKHDASTWGSLGIPYVRIQPVPISSLDTLDCRPAVHGNNHGLLCFTLVAALRMPNPCLTPSQRRGETSRSIAAGSGLNQTGSRYRKILSRHSRFLQHGLVDCDAEARASDRGGSATVTERHVFIC